MLRPDATAAKQESTDANAKKKKNQAQLLYSDPCISVALKHAVYQISQWAPVVAPAGEAMLVDKEDVLLEAGVKMWLEAELADNGVVMAVDVCVDAVHALEYLSDEREERFWEWNACITSLATGGQSKRETETTWRGNMRL